MDIFIWKLPLQRILAGKSHLNQMWRKGGGGGKMCIDRKEVIHKVETEY